jgi:hypothetical protein
MIEWLKPTRCGRSSQALFGDDLLVGNFTL